MVLKYWERGNFTKQMNAFVNIFVPAGLHTINILNR
jgi:hypothetical protein